MSLIGMQAARRIRKVSHVACWLCAIPFGLSIAQGDWLLSGLFGLMTLLSAGAYFVALALGRVRIETERDIAAILRGDTADDRPIILFLRSFELARSGLAPRLMAVFNFVVQLASISASSADEVRRYDAEEELDNAMGGYARFVAIGDKFTSYGSMKIIVTDELWRDTFYRLVDSAQLIFMMPGPTTATEWEFSQIDRMRNLLGKTIFIMPRQGSKIDLTGHLKQFITLKRYRSPEEKMWATLASIAISELGVRLPSYDPMGGYFRLLPDGRAGELVDLEAFSDRLRRYVAHEPRKNLVSITELWTWP